MRKRTAKIGINKIDGCSQTIKATYGKTSFQSILDHSNGYLITGILEIYEEDNNRPQR